MKKLNVFDLPIADNACGQLLRELPAGAPGWTIAHVTMNPGAASLLHKHKVMDEIYVITRGEGDLVCRDLAVATRAGNVAFIDRGRPHMLTNMGIASLEHLVIALPPFNPKDIYMVHEKEIPRSKGVPMPFRTMEEAIDGARVISYTFPSRADLSIAYGWVMKESSGKKRPHYHKRSTEWIYIVEGAGAIKLTTRVTQVEQGDWVRIKPEERHTLLTSNDQHMVAICICSPKFDPCDVYYD